MQKISDLKIFSCAESGMKRIVFKNDLDKVLIGSLAETKNLALEIDDAIEKVFNPIS